MSDTNLWALIIMVAVTVVIGAVAHNNSIKFHQNQKTQKDRNRFRALVQQFIKLYGLSNDTDSEHKLYVKEIQEAISTVQKAETDNDYESAIEKLQSLIPKNQAERKVLKATHPEAADFGVTPPTSNVTSAIASTLYEDTFYTVDLGNRTCTCADFKEYENYDLNDPQRICRHQYTAIKKNRLREFDYIGDFVLSSPFRESFYGQLKRPELHLILGYEVPLAWVSIWIVSPEGFDERYSFNLQTNRWSYGNSPKGLALKVRKELKTAFNL